ncbi:MAG: glycosyltransferase family 4 protein [Candidatus Levybacteria bacterium]|nr:glycosyltransferase family 4 protein [Candidatus Levybacteria bacterium]
MRILIFNWRDIKNPSSGGAEILTHELAKRWVKWGHHVTLFASLFEGGFSKENVDGVEIIRKGNPDARHLFNSVHFLAYREYEKNFKGKFDIVIDEVHGLPFFTPWYVKEKKIVLICEVADDIWIKMFGGFFGYIGRITEIFYLRLVYKKIHFITISNSTKIDLVKNGVDRKNIKVLPMGINRPKNVKVLKKENNPTIIFVGRLAKTKGVEDALLALSKLKRWNNDVKLWIVGRGNSEYEQHLRDMVKKLSLENAVTFFGFVVENKKFELMSRAHALISPSFKEGFGLTIPEAGMVGTPAVVYNSPGLSEVVINHKTGLVCNKNTTEELFRNLVKLFENKKQYRTLRDGAIEQSRQYDWQKTANYFVRIIENI